MDNFDIKSFALGVANGEGGGYPEPEGTKNITENGLYNIKDFAEANVNVPIDEPDLVDITITQNGTYNHPNKDGYDEVVVNVPIPPTPTGTISITQNGTYDVTNKASANVNVEGGGYPEPTGTISISSNGTTNVKDYASANVNVPNTYSASDSGKVVSNGELVSQTSTTKTANGTYDTTLNNSVTINVPNSYSSSDEGKVVNNGTLISQTSRNITANGTYSTPTNNEVVVNVPDSGTPAIGCVITENSTNNTFTYDIYGTNTNGQLPCAWPNYDLMLPSGSSVVINIHSQNATQIPSYFLYGNQSRLAGGPRPVYITLPDSIEYIGTRAFSGCAFANTTLTLPSSLRSIDGNTIFAYTNLQAVIFRSTPSTIKADTFSGSTDLTDIYVPWSEGEVFGAPWGATNAQIHYNYTTS